MMTAELEPGGGEGEVPDPRSWSSAGPWMAWPVGVKISKWAAGTTSLHRSQECERRDNQASKGPAQEPPGGGGNSEGLAEL
jgi:hypothetical protein